MKVFDKVVSFVSRVKPESQVKPIVYVPVEERYVSDPKTASEKTKAKILGFNTRSCL